MTSKKKSFLLHIDSLDILDDLSNGEAGVLFKAIKAYQHNEDFPLNSVVKIAFSPFKNQFFRDDEKYSKTCERRAVAGSKGGLQKVANASKCKQKVANVADSDNKNKNKTNNKNDNYSKDICQQVADEYNKILSDLGIVKVLSEKRKAWIRGSIKQMVKTDNDFSKIDTWIKYFEYVSNIDFLMGRKTDFTASFDFLVNKNNLLKVVEGNYDN